MLRIYSKEEFIMAIFKIIKNTLEGVYNTKIEWAKIPDGVTAIERDAFFSCTSLKKIIIPDSVKTIGRAAFWNCSDNLKELVFEQLSEDCDFDLEAFEKIEKPQDDLKISDTEVAYGYAEMMFGEDSI